MIKAKSFVNKSERYGENVRVGLSDYFDLNPGGDFRIVDMNIVEFFADGTSEIVAENTIAKPKHDNPRVIELPESN